MAYIFIYTNINTTCRSTCWDETGFRKIKGSKTGTSGHRGRCAGWISKGTQDPALEEAVFSLEVPIGWWRVRSCIHVVPCVSNKRSWSSGGRM